MQILCEAARRNDHTCGANISLEETQAHVFNKAVEYGWSPYVWPLNRAFPVDSAASTELLAGDLKEILARPMECRAKAELMNSLEKTWKDGGGLFRQSDCPCDDQVGRTCPFRLRCNTAKADHTRCCNPSDIQGKYWEDKEYVAQPGIVILPQLLPRPFDPEGNEAADKGIFWPRFRQLDDLLRAAEALELTGNKGRNVRLVCVDSLNAFGAGGLTRDHLAALFDLFKRRQMLAVLVVEENDHGVFAGDSQLDSDTIDFLADMVIRLTAVEEQGYLLRHIQVMKSRHQKHVLGRHPFKMSAAKSRVFQAASTSPNVRGAAATLSTSEANPSHASADMNSSLQPPTTSKDSEDRICAIEQLIANVLPTRDSMDSSFRELRDRLPEWQIGGQWRRRVPPDYGIRVFPSVHAIVAASDHLGLSTQVHTHVDNRRMWSSDSLQKMISRTPQAEPRVFAVVGPATSGKTLIAGNFLLEGLKFGEDVLLIRFSETADYTADGSWAQNRGETINFKRDDLVRLQPTDGYPETKDRPSSTVDLGGSKLSVPQDDDGEKDDRSVRPSIPIDEADRPDQVRLLRGFLSTFESQKIEYWIHEYRGALATSIEKSDATAKRTLRRPLLVEIAMKPGNLLPEEFVAIIREVFRWGRHFRQREGFDIRRAVLLDVDLIGVGYPLLKQSSTATDLFLSAFTHILRCRKTDLIMTAQTTGIPESVDMMKRAVSLADQVITCEHCDVFGDRYITVRGPGLIEGDMIRGRTPESVPGVLRRQSTRRFADYFEVDFTTLQGLVGFSSGHIRRPGVSLQLFEEGTLHAAYNSQVARLVRFALGCANTEQAVSQLGEVTTGATVPLPTYGPEPSDAPVVTVDRFDSVNATPFHTSLKLLKDSPLHNTVVRTIDEFASRQTLGMDLAGEAQERLLYAHLYYRNVLLLACDKETQKTLAPFQANSPGEARGKPIEFWDRIVQLGSEQGVTLLCDQRAKETLSCLAMDGVLALTHACNNGKETFENLLATYLQAIRLFLLLSRPLVDATSPWKLSPAARMLVESPLESATFCLDRATHELKHIFGDAEPLKDFEVGKHRVLKSASAMSSPPPRTRRYVILCWYSHLRELLALYQQELRLDRLNAIAVQDLVSNMQVMRLPGNGFTGDWYLDVPSGSVSESLGSGIKNALLQPEEDLKRFVEGVGLPAWPREESDFFCTPRLEHLAGTMRDSPTREHEVVEFTQLLKGVGCLVKELGDRSTSKQESENKKVAQSKIKNILTMIETVPQSVEWIHEIEPLCHTLRAFERELKHWVSQRSASIGDTDDDEFTRAFVRFHDLQEAARAGRNLMQAWPNSSVSVSDILAIHRLANRRSSLRNYASVRGELYSVVNFLRECSDSEKAKCRAPKLAYHLAALAARAGVDIPQPATK
jgi:KaiC/GvpD/RAD55 family RecA-like ATPase